MCGGIKFGVSFTSGISSNFIRILLLASMRERCSLVSKCDALEFFPLRYARSPNVAWELPFTWPLEKCLRIKVIVGWGG